MKNLLKLSIIISSMVVIAGCSQDRVTEPDNVPEQPPSGVSAPPIDDKPQLQP